MMMSKAQRQWYAQKRMSLAVDRQITARTDQERNKAVLWVNLWARKAGLPQG